MAKISKAFLGTILATTGWFQNKTHRHGWVDHYYSPLVRHWSGAVQIFYGPGPSDHPLRQKENPEKNLEQSYQFGSVYLIVRYAGSWLKNRNFVLDFKARDVTLWSPSFLKICLAYANANFKVASCNDDSAVSMNIPKGQKESKNLL